MLQGFFIFVFHVLMSKEVRAAFQQKKQQWFATKNNKLQPSNASKGSHNDPPPTGEVLAPAVAQLALNQMHNTRVPRLRQGDKSLTPVE